MNSERTGGSTVRWTYTLSSPKVQADFDKGFFYPWPSPLVWCLQSKSAVKIILSSQEFIFSLFILLLWKMTFAYFGKKNTIHIYPEKDRTM